MKAKQTAIDARLEQLLPSIVALQDSFQEFKGHPFQGLWSHDTIPDGAIPQEVDLTVHPGDQKHTYADFWRRVHWSEPDPETGKRTEQHEHPEAALALVKNLTVRIRFDICQDEGGWSWTMTMEYKDDSGHWSKTVNGDSVLKDWHLVVEEVLA